MVPVDKMSVVMVAIFAVIFLGERPGLKEIAGLVLITSGVLLLAIR